MLTNERADLPAITQRRALAQETRPAATPNRPQIQPRCETPPWFDGLMAAIGDELGRAHDLDYRDDNRRHELTAQLRQAEQHRDRAARLLDRHHPARAAAHKEVEAAQERVWSTNTQLRQSKGLKRRRARHQAAEATDELAAARERQQIVAAATLPDTELFRHADLEVRELRVQLEGLGRERSAALGANGIDSLTRVRDALFHWRCWAEGQPVPGVVIISTIEVLRDQRTTNAAGIDTLMNPLAARCESHGIQPPPPVIKPARPAIQPPQVARGPELDIGL